jgi:hypothetical protein
MPRSTEGVCKVNGWLKIGWLRLWGLALGLKWPGMVRSGLLPLEQLCQRVLGFARLNFKDGAAGACAEAPVPLAAGVWAVAALGEEAAGPEGCRGWGARV